MNINAAYIVAEWFLALILFLSSAHSLVRLTSILFPMAVPRLQVYKVPFSTLLNNDAGSGADKNLATWKPDRTNSEDQRLSLLA